MTGAGCYQIQKDGGRGDESEKGRTDGGQMSDGGGRVTAGADSVRDAEGRGRGGVFIVLQVVG